MPVPSHRDWPGRLSLPLALMIALFAVLWVAGGASRPDVAGQPIVRLMAAILLAIAAVWAPRPVLAKAAPVGWLLLASVVLVALQLVPLPPSVWQAMLGRAALLGPIAETRDVWRPLAIAPGAAINALFSLIVPVAVLLIAAGATAGDRARMVPVLVVLTALSMLFGLLQFSGVAIDHPLINDTPGSVSGSFANRNHLALYLAIGCVLAPVWAFAGDRRPGWRAAVGPALLLLFVLTILATGSRAGMLLGVIGCCVGLVLAGRGVVAEARRFPRWMLVASIATVATVCAAAILASIFGGRAVSIDRALEADASQDMRSRGLPVVMDMVRDYFPWGTGFGGFDPLFRVAEPFALLKPNYFNHAHSDVIEVVLDGGLPAAVLLALAVLWWLRSSIRAWRAPYGAATVLARSGSAILLLILLASVVDYPARTPMMMAVTVIAALWLAGPPTGAAERSALPDDD